MTVRDAGRLAMLVLTVALFVLAVADTSTRPARGDLICGVGTHRVEVPTEHFDLPAECRPGPPG